MKRLKPGWMQTDVPKRIKIELWRLMRDNPTFSTWEKAVNSSTAATHHKLSVTIWVPVWFESPDVGYCG